MAFEEWKEGQKKNVLIPSNSGLISWLMLGAASGYGFGLNPLEFGADQLVGQKKNKDLELCLNPLEFGADQLARWWEKGAAVEGLNPLEFGADQLARQGGNPDGAFWS